ncbi:MAG: Pyruvate synthase subunit alpha [Candidatus Roizmanbacteria bacterium GW2011_GWA2_36_23]|uniref:Pyruvate synthase subunit alpha n=1 Tax=Candidatus Roizmanbacteria bacterium GW2011_GWA2_36_23 TaxID=1618480 RepID=A0A0G0E4P5_9BACT|nr:MAG: Pyruvate synthase subunit alpha [Candidatus Roizmanbacteria bacterium GW2011_GWA2_36_23]
MGYSLFDYVEYPSLIRGGHNAYKVHVGDTEVHDEKATVDFLVCLNEDTFTKHKSKLSPESVIVFDANEFSIEESYEKVSVPFKQILSESKGQTVMKNTIALGAILATLGTDLVLLNKMIEEQFAKKGGEIIEFNKRFAELGFNHVVQNHSDKIKKILKPLSTETTLVISGNEAFSLGAVIADCRVYVAYPMTPSSTVLTTLAAWQEKNGMIVRHAEDEISVINTAIGSSFAGVRSAVGTSGGGFALMAESVSFAGVTETPMVIFIAQRPGPATGMPTWTEQGDLLFSVHSGHGEFPKIVMAAGDIEEMITLTTEAFDLADIYQLPVIMLSDMLLSESHKTITKKFIDDHILKYRVDRGKIVNRPSEQPYLRYRLTADGISEKLTPGLKGFFYQANSYEHSENGHTIEDAQSRIEQVEKRDRKLKKYLSTNFQSPKIYGNLETAKVVLVSWGTNKGCILHAQKKLQEKNIDTAYMHFTHLYPLSEERIRPLFLQNKRYVLVENNFTAQFGKLLRQETGVDIKEKILRFDGRPITAEEIVKKI